MSNRSFLVALLTACVCITISAQTNIPSAPDAPLTADAIMARVATNQDRAEAERGHFVYVQHARVQSRKGSAVMCEELTDFRITPSPKGQQQALLSLSGHVRNGKAFVHYTEFPKGERSTEDINIQAGHDNEVVHDADHGGAPVPVKETDIDLVENMRRNFTSDSNSKDGIREGLFPLTSSKQKDMIFTLKGREGKNGRDTFHIAFRPKDNSDYDWKGEAWIDTAQFQPVVVRTALSRGIPIAVKMLLGTNVPGLGFTVVYAPQHGNVWFPASFGSEFKIKIFFLFSRQIVVAVENRNFERTHVTTTIHGVDQGTSEN